MNYSNKKELRRPRRSRDPGCHPADPPGHGSDRVHQDGDSDDAWSSGLFRLGARASFRVGSESCSRGRNTLAQF